MRRISDIKAMRIEKDSLRTDGSQETLQRICITNDLVYFLSHYDRRIRVLFRRKNHVFNKIPNILASWKKSYERKARYEGRAVFDVDLRPFVNLSFLTVAESHMVDMSIIYGTKIRWLTLSKVFKVVVTEALLSIKLEEIALKELSIPYESLRRIILGVPSLMSISLDGVKISECQDWDVVLFEDLRKVSGLRKLKTVGMDVSLICIEKFYTWKNITQLIASEKAFYIEIKLGGCSVNTLRFRNSLKSFSSFNFETVESMHIDGIDMKYAVGMNLPCLKFLYVCQATIDSNILRNFYLKFSELMKIGFIGCAFDTVSFYGVILHFKDSLVCLDLRSSSLPHDYIHFLQKKLNRCLVVLKDGSSMVIGPSFVNKTG